MPRSVIARWIRPAAAVVVLALLAAPPSAAYETDQYSHRLEPLRDAREALNAQVNEALAELVARWHGPLDRGLLAEAMYDRFGGIFWVHKLERWAMKSPDVDRLPQYRWESVYRGAPVWASRVNFFFGVGRTLKVAGSLIGSDKLGHFFAQGYKYYRRYLEGESEALILHHGRFAERWIFGQATTGVLSNADLVANYEGYLFYRSLFAGDIVPGKGPILGWRDGRVVQLRLFDWADHVTDFWDEALNPSYWVPSLERAMRKNLRRLCDDVERSPASYVSPREAELAARYARLDLKAAPENRLDRICAAALAEKKNAGRDPAGGAH